MTRTTTPEAKILKDVQIAASQLGARILRNNVAKAWVGALERYMEIKTITLYPGDVVLRRARPLNAGLCVGSSDLLGWTPVEIEPAMVGKTLAVFTAAEVKTEEGRLSPEQRDFLSAVTATGGIGICARSSHALEAGIRAFKDRLRGT